MLSGATSLSRLAIQLTFILPLGWSVCMPVCTLAPIRPDTGAVWWASSRPCVTAAVDSPRIAMMESIDSTAHDAVSYHDDRADDDTHTGTQPMTAEDNGAAAAS
jgi:hypothetical protein